MSLDQFLYSSSAEDLNYPNIRPTLNLNFNKVQKVPPFINVTRNSQTTYVDKFGILRTADINQPVFEWDPTTGKFLGARIWGSVTNRIRNNAAAGAVAGTPGTLPTNWAATTPANGITRQIIGTGVEDGIDYIDMRFFGTNSLGSTYYMDINFDSGTITVAQGQTWAYSVFVKLLAGSVSGGAFAIPVSQILYGTPGFNDNGGQSLTTATSARLSSQRFALTKTFALAGTTGTSPRLAWTIATGATIDFTIRIGLPQLEQSAIVGPVVRTTGTSASSTADVWTITRQNFSRFYNQTEGTILVQYNNYRQVTGYNNCIFAIGTSSTSDSNLIDGFIGSGIAPVFRVYKDSVNDAYITSNPDLRTSHKVAFGYKFNDCARSVDSQSLSTNTTVNIPSNLTQLEIGSRNYGGVQPFNGYIKNILYWPKRLSDSQLKLLTS